MDHLASPFAARFIQTAALLLAAVVPPALLVNETRKSSALRTLYLPALVLTATKYCDVAGTLTTVRSLNQCLVGGLFPVAWQCVNALVIKPLDKQDLEGVIHRKTDGVLSRIVSTVFFLFFNLRGVHTPWATKDPGPWPRFYQIDESSAKAKRAGPGKRLFITRQLLIIGWQYVFLELIEVATRLASLEEKASKFGVGSEWVFLGGTRDQILGRITTGLSWTIPGRVTVDLSYRVISMVMVIPGFQEPGDWPPLFGNVNDSYTLRGFWSDYWHQLMRLPLTTVSNWFARDYLRLARPSFFERYFNIFLTFFQSGLIHSLQAIPCGTPFWESCSIFFFVSFVAGIMIEDAVQALWRGGGARPEAGSGSKSKSKSKISPPLWQRLVGFVWVNAWMVMAAPWLIYPIMRLDPEGLAGAPPIVTDKLGMQGALGLLVGGGLLIKLAFGGEL